jgi:phosphohistidine phosphatase
MAARAAAAGIQVDKVRHSGKMRAQQTAEIFAECLGAETIAVSGLAPNDDVTAVADAIEHEMGTLCWSGICHSWHGCPPC